VAVAEIPPDFRLHEYVERCITQILDLDFPRLLIVNLADATWEVLEEALTGQDTDQYNFPQEWQIWGERLQARNIRFEDCRGRLFSHKL
jgi:hypothetical protein